MENKDEKSLENLWSGCISESAIQNQHKESHLVLFGDHSSGK